MLLPREVKLKAVDLALRVVLSDMSSRSTRCGRVQGGRITEWKPPEGSGMYLGQRWKAYSRTCTLKLGEDMGASNTTPGVPAALEKNQTSR
jgi:hypothetical protein